MYIRILLILLLKKSIINHQKNYENYFLLIKNKKKNLRILSKYKSKNNIKTSTYLICKDWFISIEGFRNISYRLV